jgi:hypothetical protein
MRILTGIVLGSMVQIASAKAVVLQPVTPLEENFSKNPTVSGFLLVGMRRGNAAGNLDLHDLAVVVPEKLTKQLCLDLGTRDGSYSGKQVFEVASASPGTQPLELQSKYAEVLKTYAMEDLSGRAEIRDKCSDGKPGTFVPVSSVSAQGSNVLIVQVNTHSSAARVRLSDTAQTIRLDAKCEPEKSGANTTFDRVCTISIPAQSWSKISVLTVSMIGLTGGVTDEKYDVSLGSPP